LTQACDPHGARLLPCLMFLLAYPAIGQPPLPAAPANPPRTASRRPFCAYQSFNSVARLR
jgi:hypothetical protein